MSVEFTAFAFPATGAPTPRTLPARLAEIHNVRDFGAVGNGSADDLDAIMAALNWTSATKNRGTVYFPPGTYYVRAPIDFSAPSDVDSGPFVHFVGEMGLSTIVGDFADYVLRRSIASTPRWSGGHYIEKLTIINRHVGGGGIRLGVAQACSIRDCDITADIAINDDNTDVFIDGGNTNGSFELAVENCNCRPYNIRAPGSCGFYKLSDGPTVNCTFIGFDLGMGTSSGQGGATVEGCYFEGNNTGFSAGKGPESWSGAGGNLTMSGCRFKNNGTAIKNGGNAVYRGILIEAATGTIPGDPQYGFRSLGDQFNNSVLEGVLVTGEYAQAGVSILGDTAITQKSRVIAVRSINNGAGVNWSMPNTAFTAEFIGCNVAPVFTVVGLPAVTTAIKSISWSSTGGGTVTVNFVYPGINLTSKLALLTISGVTPSVYNGTFVGTATSYDQIQYPLPLGSDPGPSSGGSLFFCGSDRRYVDNVYEGYTYNVSDANTSTWGAAVTAGGGSKHVKVRYTPTKWTVMGA
jgi:hypothetical protein